MVVTSGTDCEPRQKQLNVTGVRFRRQTYLVMYMPENKEQREKQLLMKLRSVLTGSREGRTDWSGR